MNSPVLVVVAAILAMCSMALGQMPFPGACPTPTVKNPFAINQFLGKWYEQKKYVNAMQIGGKCTSVNYIGFLNGTYVVKNMQWYPNPALPGTDVPVLFPGFTTFSGLSTVGSMVIKYPLLAFIPSPYEIIDTDYSNYAIVWSCLAHSSNIANLQYLWVYTRAKTPAANIMITVDQVLTAKGFSPLLMLSTQQNCLIS